MKILMVDDHALFREGLRHLLKQLNADAVMLEASGCEQAIQLATEHQDLDLILLDLAMEDTSGLEALEIFRERCPSNPIVIVSATEDRDMVQRALHIGAAGYIPKSSTGDVMLGALHVVLSGGVYLPPLLLEPEWNEDCSHVPYSDTNSSKPVVDEAGNINSGLTIRQLEVLSLICKGESNKQIGRALGLVEGTVKIHVTAILRALKIHNRTQAAIQAKDLGLVSDKANGKG